jgi:hypothetical protein
MSLNLKSLQRTRKREIGPAVKDNKKERTIPVNNHWRTPEMEHHSIKQTVKRNMKKGKTRP